MVPPDTKTGAIGTSVKYIEEHYGHVDSYVLRKELTRECR
jgi:hypothetical protein